MAKLRRQRAAVEQTRAPALHGPHLSHGLHRSQNAGAALPIGPPVNTPAAVGYGRLRPRPGPGGGPGRAGQSPFGGVYSF